MPFLTLVADSLCCQELGLKALPALKTLPQAVVRAQVLLAAGVLSGLLP